MSYMLVGEAPNAATVGRPHLWLHPGCSPISGAELNRAHTAGRLLFYTGWDWKTYLRVFSVRTNVWKLPRPLPIHEGRRRASELILEACFRGLDGIVLLGKKPADAFGVADLEPLTWSKPATLRLALVPHTSGLNHWWNSDANKALARTFFTELLESCTTRS